MSAMSDYLEEKFLDSIFNDAAFPSNATVYIGLATTLFADDNSGVEATGGSYAREGVTADFTVAAAGSVWTAENASPIVFTTATGNWGTIVGFGVFDAISAGNLLVHGALTASQVVNTGNIIQFNAGDLVIEAQ